ncbi:uncharacterized protein AB675_2846 [Cyphellophora attinorum]|uniref:Alcohol acetyltransferase FCK4 n=1 Tax=Cyphellophora attinorum TaxID=1664694 RepID=A0A0N1HGY3_9EURO|nr:uncharacterized protein AB675_2846 [Phialophora attinorum]KPI45082.1 hypothetical protein AB675_2846 [Phialophora attinorum]
MELRKPTLNEQRCITRHSLDFYRGLVVAAVYEFPDQSHSELKPRFEAAIRHCVLGHPILGAVIHDAEEENSHFRKLESLDLDRHLRWLESEDVGVDVCKNALYAREEDRVVEMMVERALNQRFEDVAEVPPWRVFVVPMNEERSGSWLVTFNYSHSHGDGLSGLSFHRSLVEGLSQTTAMESSHQGDILPTSVADLPAPAGPFPISWAFLLSVLVNAFFPWLTSWWEKYPRSSVWTGGPMFYDNDAETATKLLTIDQQTLTTILSNWRPHEVKLTALLHLAMNRALTTELRKHGISLDPMGVNASSVSFQYPAIEASSTVTEEEVAAAQEHTRKLASGSSTSQDQVIGLLSYARPLRKWHLDKMGKKRDSSWEISNLMTIDVAAPMNGRLTRVVFAQPADASGQALSLNVVSLKGGLLEVMISWQVGALALPGPVEKRKEVEVDFMERVATAFRQQLVFLSKGPLGRSS